MSATVTAEALFFIATDNPNSEEAQEARAELIRRADWERELEQMLRDLWPLYLLAEAAHENYDPEHDTFCITRQAWDDIMDEPYQRLRRLAEAGGPMSTPARDPGVCAFVDGTRTDGSPRWCGGPPQDMRHTPTISAHPFMSTSNDRRTRP